MTKPTRIAITIDWDFFFDTDKFDFGHKENMFFINDIWNIRLMGNPELIKAYKIEPDPNLFWQKLRKLDLVPSIFYVAESHLYAFTLYSSFIPDILINFDAHHDMFTNKEMIECGNWAQELMSLERKMKYIWVRPDFVSEIAKTSFDKAIWEGNLKNRCFASSLEDLKKVLSDIGIIKRKNMLGYIARSGAWTPPWLDDTFMEMVKLSGSGDMPSPDSPITQRLYHVPNEEEIQKMRVMIHDAGVKRHEVSP